MNKNSFITRCFRILTAMTLGMTGVGVASAADMPYGCGCETTCSPNTLPGVGYMTGACNRSTDRHRRDTNTAA